MAMALKMWKPGSSKPKNNTPSEQQPNNAVPDSRGSSVGGAAAVAAVAKKLSSSTMGMRFMQRKKDGNNATSSKEKKPIAPAAPTKSVHGDHTTNNASVDNSRSDNVNIDRKRKSEEISQVSQPSSTSSNGEILLDQASIVDMYGLGSDIIGRRSFGGFRKTVMTTWEEALKRRVDDNTRTKNTKHHITDEELLERYEKYVKGRGDRESGGGSGRKEKRKRNR
ncbi:hypothetical protein ACHAWU_002633 [Discostella pseudostelligera]|uniref:Uncharacterized protein n=1 Tax=Discostella pseudostelligera TaxID=259834 RepID=A0ABD3LWE1_9STRA